jgi:hypothetical protein
VSAAKDKGDRAEREVQALLRDLLGVPARRKLGAGRADDTGDIEGVADTTIQVKSYNDVGRAIRECLDDLEEQHARSGDTFAAGFVRRPGGRYFVVLSPEMWATYWREATRPAGVSEHEAPT